jgi:hypothetical protein
MTTPDTPSDGPPSLPDHDARGARLSALRAEVAAAQNPSQRALLLHEIGVIHEVDLKNDPAAVKDYLAAFNQDPSFRPPLFALTRIFERRRNLANLPRLYEAEAKSAPNVSDRASAIKPSSPRIRAMTAQALSRS